MAAFSWAAIFVPQCLLVPDRASRRAFFALQCPSYLNSYFFSPALAKPEGSHDVRKEEQILPRSVAYSETENGIRQVIG